MGTLFQCLYLISQIDAQNVSHYVSPFIRRLRPGPVSVRALQVQKDDQRLEIADFGRRGLYYLSSENKGADQLRKQKEFLTTWLIGICEELMVIKAKQHSSSVEYDIQHYGDVFVLIKFSLRVGDPST